MEQLIAIINALSDEDFQQCISHTTYSCSKSIIIDAIGQDIFNKANGIYNVYSLRRKFFSQVKNLSGQIYSHEAPTNGNLGAYTEWKCPIGYGMRSESDGPKSLRYYCVINTADSINKGPSDGVCPSPYGGNPINFSVGNKYQEEIDYVGHGEKFTRHYNSLDGYWRHNYSARLDFDLPRNAIYLTKETGKLVYFSLKAQVASTTTEIGTLIKQGDGWIYTSPKNDKLNFNADGVLTGGLDATGRVYALKYEDERIVVTDNRGANFWFTQDQDGQPKSFGSEGIRITYEYGKEGQLLSATYSRGQSDSKRLYHYEDSRNKRLLTGITDERGVRFASWGYDDKGRAIYSEHGNGQERVDITYNSNWLTTVTNELGRTVKYSFFDFQGLKRISRIEGVISPNCPASNSSYSYNSRGQLIGSVDNKGNRIEYRYNERGLEVSRTEAYGTPQARTVITEWHPTLFLPLTVTEPDRVTTYRYDDQGRPLSQSVSPR